MKEFSPAPGEKYARELRSALGKFATGVTVVTTRNDAGPIGITVNSFASVSLDPPLVLWCPAKQSRRHDAFVAAPKFAIHIIGADQAEVSGGFTREADAFDDPGWHDNEHGVPVLDGCPARFECSIRDRIDAGDHTVIIARVDRVQVSDSEPLVFHGGIFGAFSAG